MKTKKPRTSSKTAPFKRLSVAIAWAEANRNEWDFSKVKPKERPMAVAWEYGREYHKWFLRFHPFLLNRHGPLLKEIKRPFERLHGNGIGHIFLTFWKSPHWPKKRYLDLSVSEKVEAFPKVLLSSPKTTSVEILNIVKDVTPHNPWDRNSWRNLYQLFEIDDYMFPEIDSPEKKVFLVDMNEGAQAILKSFKDHLNRAGFKQGRGRSTFEKDLLALTVHRLYPRFKTFRAMDAVLGSSDSHNASLLATEHNRVACWNYAQGRLGAGWGRKGGKSKNALPIFQFSRVDADYDAYD